MARTVNVEVRTVRREAFIDAALGLIQTKGYEQTSVQDVLDAVEASRGAFYHYFDSKVELLEAVLERMSDLVLADFAPLVNDPKVPALQKLRRLFTGIAQWKNQRKELMTELLRVWLSDENAIVREKFRRAMVARMVPLLAKIIAQGQAEGSFKIASPAHAARAVWSFMQGAQDTAAELFVARHAGAISFEEVKAALAAYEEGFERIVAAPPRSIRIADDATLRLWFAGESKRSTT